MSSTPRDSLGAAGWRWLTRESAARAAPVEADALVDADVHDRWRLAPSLAPPAPSATAARRLGSLLLPPEAADAPPPWLRPDQLRSFRRGVSAVRAFGGVLLADAVGSGKTFIGLAVGLTLSEGHPVHVVAPAILGSWWRDTAVALGIEVTIQSHESLSRGHPVLGSGPIIVDESHRFRNPGTQRYRGLAAAVIGRPGILISATPVHNRLVDAAHQLLLFVRDDALLVHGVPSIHGALRDREIPPAAFATLVVRERRRRAGRPVRRYRAIAGQLTTAPELPGIIRGIDRLALSPNRSVAELVRTVLLTGAGSSPRALWERLRRYRHLLGHARDAGRAGVRPSRELLRAALGGREDQLVLWELLDLPLGEADLVAADWDRLTRLLAAVRRWEHAPLDPKLAALEAALADGIPSLVFTTATATVEYLKARLRSGPVAWCTGSRAGIGPHRLSRNDVLGWFRPNGNPRAGRAPTVLVATDVAAEGLNLQRVGRIVHYDLPWTPVRLEQRDGRAIRLGAAYDNVEVVEFDPPPIIEAELALRQTLARKALLPDQLGLTDVDAAWTWAEHLADRIGAEGGPPCLAAVRSNRWGILAGIELVDPTGSVASLMISVDGSGCWLSNSAEMVDALLDATRDGSPPAPLTKADLARVARGLATAVGAAVDAVSGRQWLGYEPSTPVRLLTTRLLERARVAARERRLRESAELDRVIAFLGRGHQAGEAALIAAIGSQDRDGWQRLLPLARTTDRARGVEARLIAVLALVPRGCGSSPSPSLGSSP